MLSAFVTFLPLCCVFRLLFFPFLQKIHKDPGKGRSLFKGTHSDANPSDVGRPPPFPKEKALLKTTKGKSLHLAAVPVPFGTFAILQVFAFWGFFTSGALPPEFSVFFKIRLPSGEKLSFQQISSLISSGALTGFSAMS